MRELRLGELLTLRYFMCFELGQKELFGRTSELGAMATGAGVGYS